MISVAGNLVYMTIGISFRFSAKSNVDPSIYFLVLMEVFFTSDEKQNIPVSWCFNLFRKRFVRIERFFLVTSDINWTRPYPIRLLLDVLMYNSSDVAFWSFEVLCNNWPYGEWGVSIISWVFRTKLCVLMVSGCSQAFYILLPILIPILEASSAFQTLTIKNKVTFTIWPASVSLCNAFKQTITTCFTICGYNLSEN